jgi:hypothetical protein
MINQPGCQQLGHWIVSQDEGSEIDDNELKARPLTCRHLVPELNPNSQWHKRLETHLLALLEINSDHKVRYTRWHYLQTGGNSRH